jgi:hypothetical protein
MLRRKPRLEEKEMIRMPKHDRPGSSSPKSKAQRAKASATAPAKSDRSKPNRRKKLAPQKPDRGLEQPIRTPPAATLVRLQQAASDRDSERVPPLRAETTPPLTALPAQLEGVNGGSGRAQQDQLAGPAGAPTQGLGAGKRIRTPPPQSIPQEADEPIFSAALPQQDQLGQLPDLPQNSALFGSLDEKPLAKKLAEKAAQFRDIQDFLRNHPNLFDLRSKELDTSSTPEEIEARKGEVRYQMQIMRSMLALLTDELKELEEARPQGSADQPHPTQS